MPETKCCYLCDATQTPSVPGSHACWNENCVCHRGWKYEKCFACYGTGMVSDYSGGDFNGPKECDKCCGNGAYWVTPKGRHVLYPGGPFC